MSTILEFGIVQNDTLYYGASVSGTFSKLVFFRCCIPDSRTSALIRLIELSRTDLVPPWHDLVIASHKICNYLIFYSSRFAWLGHCSKGSKAGTIGKWVRQDRTGLGSCN